MKEMVGTPKTQENKGTAAKCTKKGNSKKFERNVGNTKKIRRKMEQGECTKMRRTTKKI